MIYNGSANSWKKVQYVKQNYCWNNVLENLESWYLWQNRGFLPNENIGDVLENLQELENSLQQETKIALTYITRYT